MLSDFLTFHRLEIIARCRQKSAERFAPSVTPVAADHDTTLFLLQIADLVRLEQRASNGAVSEAELQICRNEIVCIATKHGAELLRIGYTIDQVVRDYGDVCQAVTELAVERDAAISTNEFRLLNRCLDDAIAGAVTSFGSARQKMTNELADNLHARLEAFTEEHRRLVNIAIHSFSAIKIGTVGLSGATATLLTHSLDELCVLAEQSLPELHLLSEATTVTAR